MNNSIEKAERDLQGYFNSKKLNADKIHLTCLYDGMISGYLSALFANNLLTNEEYKFLIDKYN